MEFFRDTNIQFMKHRHRWFALSAAFLLVSVFAVFVRGRLNLGIDFIGGTELTLKFRSEPEIQRLREIVAAAGFGDAQIQSFGDTEGGEVLVKAPTVVDSEEGSREQIVAALDGAFNGALEGLDLNRSGTEALTELLLREDPDDLAAGDPTVARQRYSEVAESILSVRRSNGLIADWGEVHGTGVNSRILEALRSNAGIGEFSMLRVGIVGPQIGSELRRKGILAVIFSLLGMLVYIWYRFELRYGIGALVAVLHDILITLGLYSLAGLEFNLTTVAAFLTVVGYSVNDSVVVFDRVRENLRQRRGRSFEETLNLSLNQTLSRTAITSGSTLLVVGSLLVLGGDVLRGFAFILTVGVIIGTYSSICIASPFALLWEQHFGRAARGRRRETQVARRAAVN